MREEGEGRRERGRREREGKQGVKTERERKER